MENNNINNDMENSLHWSLIWESTPLVNEYGTEIYGGKRYHLVKATFPEENNIGLLAAYTKFGTECKEINFIERNYLHREFLVDVETREIFATCLDDHGFEERKLKDNKPLSKICVEAPNYYEIAHYDKIGHYMFNSDPVKPGEKPIKAEFIPKLYEVLKGKRGFEKSREDLIEESKFFDEFMNMDFTIYTGENGDPGEEFDFGQNNTDENDNNSEEEEGEGLEFVVNGSFIKNFDGKGVDGCLLISRALMH